MDRLPKLALEDPRWHELETDGYPIEEIVEGLGRLTRGGSFRSPTSRDGDGFDVTAGTLHQGSVYSSTLAMFPHAVEVAACLSHSATTADVWTWLGMIASAYRRARGRGARDMPGYLLEGYDAGLALAERRAAECFATTPLDASDAAYLIFAALALGDHRAGRFLWAMPESPDGRLPLFAATSCPRCEAETEFVSVGDGIAAFRDPKKPPQAEDPLQPALASPQFDGSGLAPRAAGAWAPVVALLRDADPTGTLPPAFERTAWSVAALGVPRDAPERAVLCIPAALIARRGHGSWSRCLARLAAEVRCPDCGSINPLVECM